MSAWALVYGLDRDGSGDRREGAEEGGDVGRTDTRGNGICFLPVGRRAGSEKCHMEHETYAWPITFVILNISDMFVDVRAHREFDERSGHDESVPNDLLSVSSMETIILCVLPLALLRVCRRLLAK